MCNTLDGNNDIYFGTANMIQKLNGNYCGNNKNELCYFIRTYYIININEAEDGDFVNATLKDKNNNVGIVIINNSNDIKVGYWYEFTFSTYNEFNDTIINVFKNSTLINVEKTEDNIDNQINGEICIN